MSAISSFTIVRDGKVVWQHVTYAKPPKEGYLIVLMEQLGHEFHFIEDMVILGTGKGHCGAD